MENLWFKNSVIYCMDFDTFRDGNGDGIGDFIGLRQGLSYLAGLGVTCIWLLPFYKSPDRDNGYDIMDYFSVHSHLGDFGDFADRGIRVIIDLVVNHTSHQHPWFQAARRRDPKYNGYYVGERMIQAIYRTKPYSQAKNLASGNLTSLRRLTISIGFMRINRISDTGNPAVRDEIKKIIGFWLALGVSGRGP